MRWRPLPTALAYAVIGPAVGVGLMLALVSPTIVDLGSLGEGPFFDIVFAVYVIGAPPLALAGLLAAVSARRGARLPTLTLLSAIYGAIFATISTLLWTFFGAVVTGSSWEVVAAIGVAGAMAGFGAALVVALLSFFRRSGATR